MPPLPLPNIDWARLGFEINDSVRGHVETTFSVATKCWKAPTFVADPYIRVHGLCAGLNYGVQAYEGLKACRTASGAIVVFRPQMHCERMAHSAATVSMPIVPESVFLECIDKVVFYNAEFVGPYSSNAFLYIRPVLFASGPQLALELPSEITFAVYVQPGTTYHGIQPLPCLVMESFDRSATRGVGHAKIGGNYAPVLKWSQSAKSQGFHMLLHLDSATQSLIDEFSTSSFIGVKGPSKDSSEKPTLVVPHSEQIITSITSDTMVQIARSLGWSVDIRPVRYDELSSFSEVLAVGTAAALLPIALIVRQSTGDKLVYCPTGEPGPVALELGKRFRKFLRGEVDDQFGWLHEVPFNDENNANADKI